MRFNFFKKKKATTEIISQSPFTACGLPEIYRGMQVYESDSDRFCTFDEDYFAGEDYEISPRKRKTISDPKTPPTFFFGIFFGALSILVISGGIAFFSLFSKFGGIYRSVTVPDFTSLSENDAINLIKENYDCFDYSIEYKDNPHADRGTVISQIPKPSTMRKLYGINGRICIKLTVSKASEDITLPSLVGQDARKVALELKNSGINVFLTEVYSDNVKLGKIIASSHPEGAKVKKNDTVYISASLGKKINYVITPSLVGISESEAITLLKKHGLDINKVIYKSSELPSGTVVEQSIEAESSVREGSKITLTVSVGINNN